jgi:VWFA-related protein
MSSVQRAVSAGSILILLATAGLAQTTPQSRAPMFKTGVDLVTVDLTVVDRDGAPIAGLSATDMTVLVDGTPRRVASLMWLPPFGTPGQSALAAARTMVFVVDPSTMRPGQGIQLLHAAARYIDQLPASARIAVAVVPWIDNASRFDESREVLKDRLLRATGNGGREVPLEQNTQGLVQDVFDRLGSIDGPKQVVLIEGTRQGDFNLPTQFTALDMLMSAASAWRSRVVVNELELWSNPGWDAMAPEHRTSAIDVAFSQRPMTDRILSTATGGLAMAPVSGDSFFARLEREQGGSYVLAFEPIDADRDGRAHEIKVKVRRDDATIRARHDFSLPRMTAENRPAGSH